MSERTVARTATRPLSGAFSLELLGMNMEPGRVKAPATPDYVQEIRRT